MTRLLKICSIAAFLMGYSALLQGCYVLSLAFEQNSLINSRRPVTKVIKLPETTEPVRKKLLLAEDVLAFAHASGLNASGAYSYYVDINRPVVSYVVEAAEPFKLVGRSWWFPIVGRVPYLGYFQEGERNRKADQLKAEGLDVSLGGVAAFSSLGWFDDPIYSSMLRRSTGDLAHLFFHELTHRTLWISGSSEFNENIAEFVAWELTQEYLTQRNLSTDLQDYRDRRVDRDIFKEWLRTLRAALEELYASAAFQALPLPERRQAKEAKFQEFLEKLKSGVAFRRPDFLNGVLKQSWNNATLLGESLYSPDFAKFEKAYLCLEKPRWGIFLKKIDDASRKMSDPFKGLDSICSDNPIPKTP